MKPESLDHRLKDLLLGADRSLPPPAMMPIRLPELRAQVARHTARRAGAAGIAAAIALFVTLSHPTRAPSPAAGPPAVSDELEIAVLEREAETIRSAALNTLVERDRARAARAGVQAVQTVEVASSAAAENAAFLLYCEADRLAKHEETADVARERYDAVAARFPGTIWARMAAQRIPTVPTEKG